jgi:hypothetical protein
MRKGNDPDQESVPLTNGSGSGRPKNMGSDGSGSATLLFIAFLHGVNKIFIYLHRCKICNKDITFYFAAVRDHIVKKHKMKMADYKTRYQAFSQEHVCTQELSELARVRCRVCGLVLLHHRIRAHLLSVHGSGRKGGYEFVKQTFYRNGNHRSILS